MSRDDDPEEPRKRISTPFVLQFNNLTYSIKMHKQMKIHRMLCRKEARVTNSEKLLLNDISGVVREGEIFGILGPSGAGKTTLIDALANKISKKSLRGSITMNGETLQSTVLKKMSAYVMQDDLLFPMLTVEETFLFSAEFRLPRLLSKSEKMARVQTVIDELGMRNAAKTLIGDEGHRGISGGERRRVSIGVDIIHDPILLFLDEPTSGLDSSSAFMVAKLLQEIARTGRIVITTVHQPSSRVVGLFDHLMFLSQGESVYYGKPADLSVFLSDFGHPITDNIEATEFMIDLYKYLEGQPGGTKSIVQFSKSWHKVWSHPYNSNGLLGLPSLKDAKYNTGASGSGRGCSEFANPFWVETVVLMKRSFISSKRTPKIFSTQIAGAIASAFVIASTFWHPVKTEGGVHQRLGFFVFVVGCIFYVATDALAVFIQERYIFMRETAYNSYRRSSYILYHSVMVIPTLLASSLAMSLITFWAVSLDGGLSSFSFYFLVIFASSWAANSLVTLVSGLVSQVMVGATIAISIVGAFVLYSGFFMPRDSIPSYWIWLHYISAVKYPFQAIVVNEFDKPDLCLVEIGAEPTKSCAVTGLDVIKRLNATDLSKWSCLWITLAFGVLYRIMFYFALLFGGKNKRK
ncbi:hypothetical protein MKW94_025746 [Papaver nudicaule]|uniref:ABC transporter domain-containing protein n=1 Tax=Papaver nudicaule TaxID=74823 RepID=A0AA42B5J0_PAPNU|nr:hypothetical protein [Papaver nudicaule]